MEARKCKGLVVLFPLPFKGHVNPMLQLATILHRRGFSITILHTTFNSPDPCRHPHFTFHFLDEQAPLLDSEASPTSDLVALLKTLNTKCILPFKNALLEVVAGEPVCCLVSDAIWSFTQAVADEVGVPRVVLRTGGAASFCAFAAFPLLKEKGYLSVQDSRLEESVAELPPLKVKDLPVIETPNPEELYQIVNNMVNGAKSSSGIIWNTFEDLEQSALATLRRQLQVPIFPIGPFHKHALFTSNTKTDAGSASPQDQSSIISWLDKQQLKSVVYVSFGSLATIGETQFLEIAWGLSNSQQTFLWVVRPDSVRGSDWLAALPSGLVKDLNVRGQIVKWVDQQDVLAHRAIGAFWTHCGWNSTLESICEGVPMICMPCFTDQRVNARYISDVWKVGVLLEINKMDRRVIERVVRRVVADEEGCEMRERCLKLKERANLCLRLDGSSNKALDSLISNILSFDSFAFTSK